jgi:hypothetical protein
VLALLLVAGFLFEQISRAKADKIPPGGQFATIRNHRLHYVRKGTDGPTVVFETAFDPAGHLQWHAVQQQLPTTFTTLSYDRAGLLWSERGDASAITSFGSVPLRVISAADKSRFDSFIQDNVLKTEMTKAWSTMQEDMLHLSTDSRQIVVSNGGHYLHQDQPEIMKEAIQAMISRVTANN